MLSRFSGVQIGAHVSISGSIANAITNASERECSAFQVFTSNPRGWHAKDLTDDGMPQITRTILVNLTLIGLQQLHICHIYQIFLPQKFLFMKSQYIQ